MNKFQFFASPWWVNLLMLGPFLAYALWRKRLELGQLALLLAAIFGAAFGFVESSVVVYLRGAIGMLTECKTRLPDSMISFDVYRQSHLLEELPRYLLTVEMYREVATMVMLIAVAILAARKIKDQLALFFWMFAAWDIFYYLGLRAAIGWPRKLTDADVLFLLPVPWLAQVWFPLLVSLLFMLAVYFSRRKIA